jgi:hypothetical protein
MEQQLLEYPPKLSTYKNMERKPNKKRRSSLAIR